MRPPRLTCWSLSLLVILAIVFGMIVSPLRPESRSFQASSETARYTLSETTTEKEPNRTTGNEPREAVETMIATAENMMRMAEVMMAAATTLKSGGNNVCEPKTYVYDKPVWANEPVDLYQVPNASLLPFPSSRGFEATDRFLNDTKTQMFKGQGGEDKFLYSRVFRNLENGSFLEFGALGGVRFSNTYFFQLYRGWKGILLEPELHNWNKLKRNPRCVSGALCMRVAVATSFGKMTFRGIDAAAGFEDTMTKYHHRFVVNLERVQVVETVPLGILLNYLAVERIDFWSLDVEGAEVFALESMDWSIPVYVILIEQTNSSTPERLERCTRILQNEGFRLASLIFLNQLWIKEGNAPALGRRKVWT